VALIKKQNKGCLIKVKRTFLFCILSIIIHEVSQSQIDNPRRRSVQKEANFFSALCMAQRSNEHSKASTDFLCCSLLFFRLEKLEG